MYQQSRQFMKRLPEWIRDKVTGDSGLTAETTAFNELVRVSLGYENATLQKKYYRVEMPSSSEDKSSDYSSDDNGHEKKSYSNRDKKQSSDKKN